MLNALRLRAGFAEALYEARTGQPLAGIESQLASLVARGLLEREAGICRPSPLGYRFLNDLVSAFILAPPVNPTGAGRNSLAETRG
jgi:oxygen-independent coproporphyrinogen-3 oxidase